MNTKATPACTKALKAIDGLNSYIESLEEVRRTLGLNFGECPSRIAKILIEVNKNLSLINAHRKKLEYNSIIISLYGIYQCYVREVVQDYVKLLSKIHNNFDSLPRKIKDGHLQASFKLIERINSRGHKSFYTEREMIENICSCYSGVDYNLNFDAFGENDANIRHKALNDIFGSVGIDGIAKRILSVNEFRAHVADIDDHTTDNADLDTVYKQLNDFIESRNDVAHGLSDSVIAPDLLKETTVKYIRSLICGIDTVVQSSLLDQITKNNKSVSIGFPLHVYKKHVGCFSKFKHSLKVGDTVFIKDGSGFVKEAKVLGLQINRLNYEKLGPSFWGIDIGIRFDSTIKLNMNVHIPCMKI